MGKLFEKIANTAVGVAGAAGIAANVGGLIPNSNAPKTSPMPTKQERTVSSFQANEKKDAIKKAKEQSGWSNKQTSKKKK